ncbi:MAG TPA: 5-dehydro-2-deoxygluconokinase [Steroidobacteraceae bacterium]
MNAQLDLITIGRVSVDLYGQQLGSRLEDAATFAKAVGGCPANVAIGAARLGLSAALISRVGDEPMGRFVQEQLAREGVATRGLRIDPQRLTSLVLLGVRDEQTFPLIFYRDNCADSALGEEDIDEEFIASARAILVTGTHFSLAGGARAQHKAIEIAQAHGRAVILDIDYRPNLWGIGGHGAGESRYAPSARVTTALAPVLRASQLIVGTEEELHIAGGSEDTLEALRRIRTLSDAVIVCKRGARGCAVFAGQIPATFEEGLVTAGLDVEIYNVLGAGDAFLAGFLSGYLRGLPHEESARRANACGALAVSRLLCSSEFATRAELDHLLAHGSAHRALRHDPQLSHLHHVTTRRPHPGTLRALAIAGRAQLQPVSGTRNAVPDQLERLQRLALQAAARVAARREGFGILLDVPESGPAWREAVRSALWVARATHRQGSRPLEFASTDSLALRLTEWPIDTTVYCRCEWHADDPRELEEAQERRLKRLAAICRAQGREWLLEVAGAAPTPFTDESLTRVLMRLYALDIRPDWWALEPQADRDAWDRCTRLISTNDPYCRGVLLTLAVPAAAAAALTAAARVPLVRGFIAGGSIFAATTTAYLAGQLSDEAAVAAVAECFGDLVEAWAAARDPKLDRP